jgi:hypothetical protein
MSERTAFPISWPEGWPRTAAGQRKDAPFFSSRSVKRSIGDGYYKQRGAHSMEDVRRSLSGELAALGARHQILSTNVKLRIDGAPYSGQAQPADPGAAVYFELKGKPVSLACDKWRRVEDNIWAICKHIEALRGQERWGVGNVEQAFRGYMALPGIGQTSGSNWWQVLGVPINAGPDQVKDAYRLLVAKHHPDKGGDAGLFRRVTEAYQQFERIERKTA